MRLLCRLGFHKWERYRVNDIHEFMMRECARCRAEQTGDSRNGNWYKVHKDRFRWNGNLLGYKITIEEK